MPLTVRVKQFQSIEDATIRIEGLTVITGTNNTGKSALFRAIRGAFTNARGTHFVRKGATHCSVELQFDDGNTVIWEKGAKANRYEVNGRPFSKVGHGPPDEVKALGVRSLSIGGIEVWPQIAPQFTGVQFLLDQPAPVLAEALADVERVNHINRALRAVDTDRRNGRADLRAHEELLARLQVQRDEFQGLEVVLEELSALEERHAELSRLASEAHALEAIRSRMQTCRDVIQSLEGLDLVEVPKEETFQKAQQLHQVLYVVADLSSRVQKARQDVQKARDQEPLLEEIQKGLNDQAGQIQGLEQLVSGTRILTSMADRLQQRRAEFSDLGLEVAKAEEALCRAKAEVSRVLGSFEECPTCGAEIQ